MQESRKKGAGMRDQDPPFQTLLARATFDCAGAKFFLVFSIFDDHAILCDVKSDKRNLRVHNRFGGMRDLAFFRGDIRDLS